MGTRPIRENLLSSMRADGKLLADKCSSCGQVFFPKNAAFCFNCLSGELEEIYLSGQGVVHSYTRCEVASEFFNPPYVCGVIDLEEGIKIFAPLHPEHMDVRLEVGLPVEIVVGVVWNVDNESVIGYHFRPGSTPG